MPVHNVDLNGLAKSLYERRDTGIIVPYEPQAITGWTPSEHECHINVDRFVRENGNCKTVRGWMVFDRRRMPLIGELACWRFNAHSVIENIGGRLFDITPSRASQRYPFIRHPGPDGEFETLIGPRRIMHLDVMASGRVSIGVAST